jgi:hypothetical protein
MNSNISNKKQNSKNNNQNIKEEDNKRLLDYYRLRIEGIIKERIDWLKELEGINIANNNFHEKEWELYNLNDKIAQLQQSLSESNMALNNERRRIIAFNTEIDTFKSKLNYKHNKYLIIYKYSKIKR